jgi:hypothetical protein
MKTKAELEEELALLRLRVAELEGAVEAYRYALAQTPPPQPNTDANWWWTPQVFNTQPSILPCVTS